MEVQFPKLEEKILKRWKTEKTFEQSVAQRKKSPRFVFYEGPPTANGKPGIHHVLGRVLKDIVCRYKTMQGFLVERRAGWDTHGLPVELQVEKKLGLKSKKEIEAYGIAKFNKECKKSVWEYKKEWEELTERIGFWLDTSHPYVTYEPSYIETLWFIIKQLWAKKLLYKDYKVVPYCLRCGTPLSSHELAQGYKTVEDTSIYIKFKVKAGQKVGNWITDDSTYILSWTTTPWTLPGNVALAVGEDIQYVKYWRRVNGKKESFIVAEQVYRKEPNQFVPEAEFAQAGTVEFGPEVEKIKGKDLVGLTYEQLFPIPSLRNEKSHKVYAANFVTTTDGTGVVHTAVMYGEDDYSLGVKVGLPQHHTVTEAGVFTQEVPGGLAGLPVRVKETDEKIFAYLKENNTFFATQPYSHEYPFCWRCSTPLLYYAKETWFINMQQVRAALLKNNAAVNWVPAHLKEGRMGEWLQEVKDWAFSRERYWGTPLPLWECNECHAYEAIGSVRELALATKSSNSFYFLRHGHSERQVTEVMSSWPEKKKLQLTRQGIAAIKKQAKALKKKNIQAIFSSDLLRTKQTAEIVGKELGLQPIFDQRLRELNVGDLNGKHISEIGKVWGRAGETSQEHYLRRFEVPMPHGESWGDVRKRMVSFVEDVSKKFSGAHVLVISHEVPLTLLEAAMKGFSNEETIRFRASKALKPGEARVVPFSKLPFNEKKEIDLHRPYVDAISFVCKHCKKGTMSRVKEVVDVWYDSGAMPFAQEHWPFERKTKNYTLKTPVLFPADYIVEGIDQTRGWFYTLLAVSTLLGFHAPYKNVVSFSHVLDEKGEKMSKSKGNVVDPWSMITAYGIDAVRWYFYTINHPGDSKLFSEKDIQQSLRKFILTLWNSFVFYKTYVPVSKTLRPGAYKTKTNNVLDSWIFSRLSGVTDEATQRLEEYDITGAARAIESFVVEDMSLWYIRRSRGRFQNPATQEDFASAQATLQRVLAETSTLCAPFIPFLSEHIYTEITGRKSVHYENWPSPGARSQDLETQMQYVRDIVAKTLAERAKAGIKVRQPLQKVTVKTGKLTIGPQLLELLKEEVNVKEIAVDEKLASELELDTVITPQLKEEGELREIMRQLQDMRKEAGFKPRNQVRLYFAGSSRLTSLIAANEHSIAQAGGFKEVRQGERPSRVFDIEKEVELGGEKLLLAMKKA